MLLLLYCKYIFNYNFFILNHTVCRVRICFFYFYFFIIFFFICKKGSERERERDGWRERASERARERAKDRERERERERTRERRKQIERASPAAEEKQWIMEERRRTTDREREAESERFFPVLQRNYSHFLFISSTARTLVELVQFPSEPR